MIDQVAPMPADPGGADLLSSDELLHTLDEIGVCI